MVVKNIISPFRIKFETEFEAILINFDRFSFQNGPKIDPKSSQNLIKNRLRIDIDFQVDFSLNFGQFFVDFQSNFD